MMIISFAWTTPALLAGQKTVTRRNWSDRHARLFHAGDHVAAWDRSPHLHGKQVAVIELTHDPYKSEELPHEDWSREGFDYLTQNGLTTPDQVWGEWLSEGVGHLLVVRFRLVKVEAA